MNPRVSKEGNQAFLTETQMGEEETEKALSSGAYGA